MKAVVIREWTDPQVFPIEEVAKPAPGEGEVLLKVHTVGLTFGDMLLSTGRYQIRPKLPFTPSTECSAVVEAVGPGVTAYQPGDRVAAMGFIGRSREERRIIGACREYVAVPEENLAKLPADIDLEQAALVRSNGETSLYALQRGGLQAGETLLVLGAAGGTGYAAISLGKWMGARVIASASSPEKRAIAAGAGADHVIDSRAPDWREQVTALVGTRGVDVVFDPVGGEQAERAFRTLSYGGRFLVIGFAEGTIPRLPLNLPLLKQASAIGCNLLLAYEAEPERVARNKQLVVDLFARGQLTVPPISGRYGILELGEALRTVAEGKQAGRIVLSFA